MPQLDKVAFTAQLVWFFSVFFVIFLLLCKSYLPTLGFILKFRSRLLSKVVASKTSASADYLIVQYTGQLKGLENALQEAANALLAEDISIKDRTTLCLVCSHEGQVIAETFKEEYKDLLLRKFII